MFISKREFDSNRNELCERCSKDTLLLEISKLALKLSIVTPENRDNADLQGGSVD